MSERRIVHTGGTHDRASARRPDGGWLAAQARDPRARALRVALPARSATRAPAGRIPVRTATRGPQLELVPLAGLQPLPDGDLILVGLHGDAPLFAAPVAQPGPLAPGAWWADLAVVAPLLPVAEAALVAHALPLVEFARRHRQCGACGARMAPEEGGIKRRCKGCAAPAWPRTDPVVLALVHDEERVLLGRERGWPERDFSLLAGFVEPGESAEEAVVREIGEEARVRVGDLRWFGSQPWPYPHELMLGFFARWLDGVAAPGDDELAEVGWFTREEVAAALRGDAAPFDPPAADTLAHTMLEAWVSGG